MKFTADMLLTENYNMPTEVAITSTNESYFSMALNYVNEMSNQFNEANKVFYKDILEAGDNRCAITESCNSFADKVKEIIDKFLAFIKRVVTKFVTMMNKIVKSDKYLVKRKDDFSKFSDTFDMKVYKFSRLDDPTFPKCEPYETYNSIAKDLIFVSDGTETNTDYVITRMSDVYSNIIEDTTKWYNLFRGEVIGKPDQEFTSKEYEDELFEIYRSGESSPSVETIGAGEVIESYQRFANYEKSVKAVTDLKNKLEREYSRIKKEIKALSMSDVDSVDDMINGIFDDSEAAKAKASVEKIYKSDDTDDKDKLKNKLDAINKAKISRIEGMCTIHSLAFTKKLDAIKAAYNQDKKILYRALKSVNNIKEHAFISDSDTSDRIVESYEYTNFLIRQGQTQNDIVRYIGECVALESCDYQAITSINESAIDVIKDIIEKIWTAIKSAFAKFTTSASALLTTDATFLDKYKKIILNKPFKDRTITMNKYDLNGLKNGYKVPNYDKNKFDAITNAAKTEGENGNSEFVKQYQTNLPNVKPGDDIKEKIIELLTGEEEEEMNMQTLDKNAIWNFCVKYKDTIKDLEADQNIIANNQSKLNAELGRISRELDQEAKDKAAQTNANEAVYSNVYNTYITELKAGKVNDTSTTTSTGNTTGKGDINSGTVNLDNDTTKGIANSVKSDIQGNSEESKNSSDSINKYKEAASVFFNCCGNILMAKLTVSQKIYKDYIKILRLHVKDYAGETAEGADGSAVDSGPDNSEADGNFSDANGTHTVKYLPNKAVKHGSNSTKVGKSLGNEVESAYTDKLDKYIAKCKGFASTNKNWQTVLSLDGKNVSFINNKWYYVNSIQNRGVINKDDTITPDQQ